MWWREFHINYDHKCPFMEYLEHFVGHKKILSHILVFDTRQMWKK